MKLSQCRHPPFQGRRSYVPTALATGAPNDGAQALSAPRRRLEHHGAGQGCVRRRRLLRCLQRRTQGHPGLGGYPRGAYVQASGIILSENANAAAPPTSSSAMVRRRRHSCRSPVTWNGNGTSRQLRCLPRAHSPSRIRMRAAPPTSCSPAPRQHQVGCPSRGIGTAAMAPPPSGCTILRRTFFLKNTNAPGAADVVFGFGPGGAGWKPIVGDWNGDGVPSGSWVTGTFFLRNRTRPAQAQHRRQFARRHDAAIGSNNGTFRVGRLRAPREHGSCATRMRRVPQTWCTRTHSGATPIVATGTGCNRHTSKLIPCTGGNGLPAWCSWRSACTARRGDPSGRCGKGGVD